MKKLLSRFFTFKSATIIHEAKSCENATRAGWNGNCERDGTVTETLNRSLYDRVMLSVPDFEVVSQNLVKRIERRGTNLRVLEIGSGTGLLSARILESSAVVHLTCVDPDVEACNTLTARFGGCSGKLHVHPFPASIAPIDSKFDVVVSRFSMHHVPDWGKAEFLAVQASHLRSGGLLLVGDMVLPHYNDESDRPKAVRSYYKVTTAYACSLASPDLVADQIKCLQADLNCDEEYKICKCRMINFFSDAGLYINQIEELGTEQLSHSSRFWPGLIVMETIVK